MNGVIENGAANGQTFQSGDTINNAGNVNVTAAVATAAPVAATINTAQNVNFTLLTSQAIDASLWTSVANMFTNSTTAATTLTVTGGALATTYGVNGTQTGGLDVTIRAQDLVGTANTLNLSAAGAGLFQTRTGLAAIDQQQTITMSSNGVESVSLATSGSNNLVLVDNPAAATPTDYATLNVTGSGNNLINVAALTQTTSFNLSTATGNNTLRFNQALQSNTTITDGTGTATVRVDQASVVAGISLTGVEILRSATGAGTGTIGFNAGSSLTTLRVDGDGAEATGLLRLINPGAVSTVNYVGDGLTASLNIDQEFKQVTVTGAYSGTADTVTMNLSNQGTTNLAGYTAGAFIANGVEAFTVNATQAGADSRTTMNRLESNTLQTVTFNAPGAVTATLQAAPNAGNAALTSINLSGVTGNGISQITLAEGAAGAATQVLGSTGLGGTTLITGIQGADDVILFIGSQGNDTVTARNGAGARFAGTLVATMGEGTNTVNVGDTTVGADPSTSSITLNGAGSTNTINGGAGVDTITVTATGLGSTNAVRGEAGADVIDIAASTVAVQLEFTTGLSIDTVTGFTLAKDVAAFDLSSLETASNVVNAVTIDIVNGGSVSVTAGATVVAQTLAAAGNTLSDTANVFIWTVGTADNAAALETAWEAALINNGTGTFALSDAIVVQYTTAAGVERLALVINTDAAGNAAGTDIDDVEVVDIAVVGTTGNLTAANFAFIV